MIKKEKIFNVRNTHILAGVFLIAISVTMFAVGSLTTKNKKQSNVHVEEPLYARVEENEKMEKPSTSEENKKSDIEESSEEKTVDSDEKEETVREKKSDEWIEERFEEEMEKIRNSYKEEESNTDAYFKEKAETVYEGIDAETSGSVKTESETIADAKDRGFDKFDLTALYDMEGEYIDKTAEESDEKHPMYQTSYVNANNEIWNIYIVNGEVMAEPLSFDLMNAFGSRIMFTETDHLTSYDSANNQFITSVPKEDELKMYTVDRLDADFMEKNTAAELELYVQKH